VTRSQAHSPCVAPRLPSAPQAWGLLATTKWRPGSTAGSATGLNPVQPAPQSRAGQAGGGSTGCFGASGCWLRPALTGSLGFLVDVLGGNRDFSGEKASTAAALSKLH